MSEPHRIDYDHKLFTPRNINVKLYPVQLGVILRAPAAKNGVQKPNLFLLAAELGPMQRL